MVAAAAESAACLACVLGSASPVTVDPTRPADKQLDASTIHCFTPGCCMPACYDLLMQGLRQSRQNVHQGSHVGMPAGALCGA